MASITAQEPQGKRTLALHVFKHPCIYFSSLCHSLKLEDILLAGYVAISKPQKGIKKDIVIVFRGTSAVTEWESDAEVQMVKWSDLEKPQKRLSIFGIPLPLFRRIGVWQKDVVMVEQVRHFSPYVCPNIEGKVHI